MCGPVFDFFQKILQFLDLAKVRDCFDLRCSGGLCCQYRRPDVRTLSENVQKSGMALFYDVLGIGFSISATVPVHALTKNPIPRIGESVPAQLFKNHGDPSGRIQGDCLISRWLRGSVEDALEYWSAQEMRLGKERGF